MSSLESALIVFACLFASTMLGLFLGRVLPDRLLEANTKEIVKLATGLIATLSALVLSLLVSSAKGTFDEVNNEVKQMAVQTVMLDRTLAQYGPETGDIRATIKTGYSAANEQLFSGDESQISRLDTPQAMSRLEGIQTRLRALAPQNDVQKALQSRAIDISSDLEGSRWLMVLQRKGSVPTPLLVVMVCWLSVIFVAWGIVSPRNLLVALALLVSALAVSGATLMILEMDRPLSGWIRVSPVQMQQAIDHLGA